MRITIILLSALLAAAGSMNAQVLIPDFVVNNAGANIKGVWGPKIAAAPDGRFAVAWQDYNEYNIPAPEIPRIVVQLFSADGSPAGPAALFQGESRNLSIWTSDFLENVDLGFTPDGTLLVAVEHEGRLSIGIDDVGSAETGIGALNRGGEILDLSNGNGVIYWMIDTKTKYQEHPRLAVSPAGDFYLTAYGPSYDTNYSAVLIQAFDASGNTVGDPVNPHASGSSPSAHHRMPDITSNGELILVAWQDGRADSNYDNTAQFFTTQGAALGTNLSVNRDDPAGTYNVLPSAAMNRSGESVIVWADTRTGFNGDIWGQRFDASGSPVGGNFQVSAGSGEIYYRPEVAMLDDGRFMVVWTDSSSVPGQFRARGRQFSAGGAALGPPFVLPSADTGSGLPDVEASGNAYLVTWIDDRAGQSHVYAKKIGLSTSTGRHAVAVALPSELTLAPVYPNPFNDSAVLEFNLPISGSTVLRIFNPLGQMAGELVNDELEAGLHRVTLNARNLSSGIYFTQLQQGPEIRTQRFVLLR